MNSFSLLVFGCQMNVQDGDRLRTHLLGRGMAELPPEEADLVLLVTCSIRAKAEDKVLSLLGRLDRRFRSRGRPAVVVAGCMAQRMGASLFSRFSCVRALLSPRLLGRVEDLLESLASGERLLLLHEGRDELFEISCPPLARENPVRAYLTVAHGCDNFCTYCVVPYVRGSFRSRPPEAVLEEAKALLSSGARLLCLVGQNVTAYGRDLGVSFEGLLLSVSSLEGPFWLSFTTCHPRDTSPRLFEAMAESPRAMRAINLPVQSGSDEVLRRMGRGYTREDFLRLVRLFRSTLGEMACATSDVIVGFPGETEEDFERTLDLLERAQLDMVHSAAFSPRPGTAAARMEGELPEEVKRRRLNELNALQRSISLRRNRAYVGREVVVLLEEMAPKGGGRLQGRTHTDKPVVVEGDPGALGRFALVAVRRAGSFTLYGDIIRLVEDEELEELRYGTIV